jgi:hypothetical protein
MKNYLVAKYMFVVLAGAFVLSSSLLGCGGGSGSGGGCGKVYPCGGNIVGTWKVASFCSVEDTTPPDFCPTATLATSTSKLTGGATYKADMTFSGMLTANLSVVVTYPNSCLTFNGVTLTCAQFEAAQKQALAMDPNSPIQSLTCAATGSSCKCTGVTGDMSTSAMGTYTTAGTKLTENQTGMAPDESSYCVQGNTLHIVGLDMTMPMGMMGQFKITNDVVLTKQ